MTLKPKHAIPSKTIDLHGLRLVSAQMEVCNRIEEAWVEGEDALLFIHGFHQGQAIKNFLRRRDGLIAIWTRNFSDLPKISIIPRDDGNTYVLFIDGGAS